MQFQKLFDQLNMGEIISEPKELFGGHLHHVFTVETEQGKYAIKALNPKIMLRPNAMRDYINTEKIAVIAAKMISVSAAKIFGGSVVQKFENLYYLIYDFIDGTCIQNTDVELSHCEKMGAILADLHSVDFSSLGLIDDYSGKETCIDWFMYLQKGLESKANWVDLLSENKENLYSWNERLIKGSKQLNDYTVITHGDLEPKNVLWKDTEPIIIDWESAGFVNPAYDLIETALYWSKQRGGGISKERFLAFINAYKARKSLSDVEWDAVFDKGFAMLGWMEYSLKRSLFMECSDEAEQKMGTDHVFGTIRHLLEYEKMIPSLKEWMGIK